MDNRKAKEKAEKDVGRVEAIICRKTVPKEKGKAKEVEAKDVGHAEEITCRKIAPRENQKGKEVDVGRAADLMHKEIVRKEKEKEDTKEKVVCTEWTGMETADGMVGPTAIRPMSGKSRPRRGSQETKRTAQRSKSLNLEERDGWEKHNYH